MNNPVLEALAKGLGDAGVRVARFEFPYMRKARVSLRRRPPDPMARLEEAYRDVISRIGPPETLVLGGFSMGGRVASRIVDAERARALVCVSYPFHPPGHPSRLRTEHLQSLRTRALFVQGTRDRFGTPGEAQGFGLSSSISFHLVADGGHDLVPRKSSGRTLADNLAEATLAVDAFLRGLPSQK